MHTAIESNWWRAACPVGGQWIAADNGETFPVNDPATGELLAQVPRAGAAEARRAIEAAQAAWGRRTADERAEVLRCGHALMLAHQDALAEFVTREQGKPLAEARGEIG